MVTMHCPICTMPRSFHGECFTAALSWVAYGQYDSPPVGALACRLAPTCYLCGVAKTEHAEHLTARHIGGADAWSNVGGACALCNWKKSYLAITLTPDQQQRWDAQQAAYQAAHVRATAELVSAEFARRTINDMSLLDSETPDIEWFAEAAADLIDIWIDTEQTPTTVTLKDDHALINFTATGVRLAIFPAQRPV